MKKFLETRRLPILLTLSMLAVAAIAGVMAVGFDVDNEPRREKIGFIILGDIREAGWNASHYNGIKAACDEFNLELLVRDIVEENTGQCPKAIEELINEGAGMIFLASYSYSTEALPIIEANPDIAFATNSTKQYAKNLTAYFVRMYQGRYMSGALAGMRTKTNVIGYVAAMPTPEVNRGINAFALGVKRVNPKAKVLVMWTHSWQDEDVEKQHARRLIVDKHADVIAYHQDEAAVCDVADCLGVDFIGYNAKLAGYSHHCLTSQLCRWDLFYNDIVQRYLKGELNATRNQWLGMRENVILFDGYSELVTPEMRATVERIRAELHDDRLIFIDEIRDNKGQVRCARGEAISDDFLLERINWLVEGVEVID